jgi:hypothetical protein
VQDPGQIEPRQHAGHLLVGEHMRRDETAERRAKPFLLMWDDRRVRDRDAQGMTEQSGHREPVGDPADEACLGRRLQQIPPPPPFFGQHVAAKRERGHQDEQRCGEGPVPREGSPRFGVGIEFCHAALSIAAAVAERTPVTSVHRPDQIG